MGIIINKLPSVLKPLALRMVKLTYRFRIKDSELDVNKKLAFGVEYVYEADVQGDIAEFGTMTGRTASVLSHTMSILEKSEKCGKKLNLFDSFIGLPETESEVDKKSPHVVSGVWGVGTCEGISKEALMNKCLKHLPGDKIFIYDGWFKDTLPQIPKDTKFSLVHIDCDLYQSTIEVLDYLFDNSIIQSGTSIFFDDYNCNQASPEFGERRAWNEVIKKHNVIYTDCGEYGWSGRKFIVHSYNPK